MTYAHTRAYCEMRLCERMGWTPAQLRDLGERELDLWLGYDTIRAAEDARSRETGL